MKDPFILKILDVFATLFRWQNIDYDKMRLVMKLKFIEDRRKPGIFFKNMKLANKSNNMSLYDSLMFLGMGVLYLAIIAAILVKSFLIGSVIFFTLLMLTIFLSIIMEFSLDFFSSKDQVVLLSKPIGYREINAAKTLHVFLYMLGFALTLSLPTLIFMGIRYNPAVSIITLVFIIFSLMFLLFCSALIYGLILSRFSGEKLKDTLSMVQIVSVIVIFAGFQVFMNYIIEWIIKVDITGIPGYLYLLPSTWFALPSYMAAEGYLSLTSALVVLAAILFTVFGFRCYFSQQSEKFEKNLYKLKLVDTKIYKRKKPLALKFAAILKSNLNRTFYKFSVIMLTRERRLKQVIYPIMAMSLIYPIVFLYSEIKDPDIIIAETNHFLYFYGFLFWWLSVTIYTNFSEYYKASWLFYYLPLKSPKNIFIGAKSAVLVCYQLGILFISAMIFLIFWNFSIIPDTIVMILNSLIILFCYQEISNNVLPFSEKMKTGKNSAFQHFSYYLAVFVFIPVAAVIHILLNKLIPQFTLPFILIQVTALYFLTKNQYNIEWKDLHH